MAKLITRKTDDEEWSVFLDGTEIGMVYRVSPGDYRAQYTYVDHDSHERARWAGPNEWGGFSTLREAAIRLEENHSGEWVRMTAIARARRSARERGVT